MKLVYKLALFLVFFLLLAGVIAYARGYRLDIDNKKLFPTGILAISSSPKAATIYINGVLKGVTDNSLTLPPGTYTVEIKKEGYTSWSKSILLKGELVESLDAVLFPINPSLSPLTNLGVVRAIPVDQTDRVIVFAESDSKEKDGIYIFDQSKRPLSFLPPLKLIVLKSLIPLDVDFSKAEAFFSHDFKEVILEFPVRTEEKKLVSYLFSLETETKELFETTTSKETLLTAWEEERQKNMLKVLETFPKEIRKIATDSFTLVAFSPDETKLLYRSKKTNLMLPFAIKPRLIATNQTPEERTLKKGTLYVYDKKEDKNLPFILANNDPSSILWYSDSKHLIFRELAPKKKISIADYDGTNKQTIYSGPFDESFFTTTTDSKLIILTNLNPDANLLPDLYLVGIR